MCESIVSMKHANPNLLSFLTERLESPNLLNIKFAKNQKLSQDDVGEMFRFKPAKLFSAFQTYCGVAIASTTPLVEIWQVAQSGKVEEYAVYWPEIFKGIVMHKFNRRCKAERVFELAVELSCRLDKITGEKLETKIELIHAPKNIIENTERLFQTAKIMGKPPTVAKYLDCILKGRNYIHRAHIIHGEIIPKIFAAAGVGQTEGD